MQSSVRIIQLSRMSRKYKILNPHGIYFITPTVVNWNPVFIRKIYLDEIINSLSFCQKNKGLKIHSYCIMPSHLHLIISCSEGKDLIAIIRDFKKFTSSKLLRMIAKNAKESRRHFILDEFAKAGEKNCHNHKFQFWQHHNKPLELTTNRMIDNVTNYIHENPVKAGLCETAESYLYSSANPDRMLLRIDEI